MCKRNGNNVALTGIENVTKGHKWLLVAGMSIARASCRAVFIKYKWDALLQLYEEKSVPSAPSLWGTSLFMMLFTASAHVMFYIFHFFQLENNTADLVKDCFPPLNRLVIIPDKECNALLHRQHTLCYFEMLSLRENFENTVASSRRPIHVNPTSTFGCVYTHTQTSTLVQPRNCS